MMVNEGAKVVDICTTLMGLSDVASDGSPLFAEPVSLRMSVVLHFNLLHVYLLTELRELCSAWGTSITAIDSYKKFLHTHCFGFPELVFPLKSSFPIILFRFLETNVSWNQSSYAMKVPLTFIFFLAKVTTLFLK